MAIRTCLRLRPAARRDATPSGGTSSTAMSCPMPDTWEYPWFASWDTAFHMICFARLDPEYAKKQLILFLREWYMHPSGKIPAYEFNLSDVNPPGPCVGLLAGLQNRLPRRQARPGVSGQRVPEAAPGLHLVGQSQGPDRPEHLLRRIPGPGQYRPVRPLPAAAQRRISPAGRCDRLDGVLLRHHALDGPGAGPGRPGL